jgi:hypothetical protein
VNRQPKEDFGLLERQIRNLQAAHKHHLADLRRKLRTHFLDLAERSST